MEEEKIIENSEETIEEISKPETSEEVKPAKKNKKKKQGAAEDHFPSALSVVFRHEGGLNSKVKKIDRGGLTKYGVSLRFLKLQGIDINWDGVVNEQDIYELTKEEAEDLFREFFWDASNIDNIRDRHTAIHVFDLCINHGNRTAIKMVQQTLNSLGSSLVVDGVNGNKTTAALNRVDVVRFNNALVTRRVQFYDRIVRRDPSQVIFLEGWNRRARSFQLK